jgi:hypothetical protein
MCRRSLCQLLLSPRREKPLNETRFYADRKQPSYAHARLGEFAQQRTLSAYWIDYAGPGEPPRSTPRPAKPTRGSNRWLLAEIESMVEQTKKAIDHAGTASPGMPAATLPTLEPPPAVLPPPSDPGESIASR